jgi:virulence-associated protein VagC
MSEPKTPHIYDSECELVIAPHGSPIRQFIELLQEIEQRYEQVADIPIPEGHDHLIQALQQQPPITEAPSSVFYFATVFAELFFSALIEYSTKHGDAADAADEGIAEAIAAWRNANEQARIENLRRLKIGAKLALEAELTKSLRSPAP